MKIKKSDIGTVVQWIDVQLAQDDKFPFDITLGQEGSSKASKKHLKALKSWRKCSHNVKEVREWCQEWLDTVYETKLKQALEQRHTHKADQALKLTPLAFDLLMDQSEKQGLSPSELIVAYLSEESSKPKSKTK